MSDVENEKMNGVVSDDDQDHTSSKRKRHTSKAAKSDLEVKKPSESKRGRKRKDTTPEVAPSPSRSKRRRTEESSDAKETKSQVKSKSMDVEEDKQNNSEAEEEEEKINHRNEAGGIVFGFGDAGFGQLGIDPSASQSRKFPTLVPELASKKVVALSCGAMHNAVVLDNGELLLWGNNDDNALGRVAADETEWIPTKLSITLPNGKEASFVDVKCGDCHTIALTDTGLVYSWGKYKNNEGTLGYSTSADVQVTPMLVNVDGHRVKQIAAGSNHDVVLTENGQMYSWTAIRNFQFNRPLREQSARAKLVPRPVIFKGVRRGKKFAHVFASLYCSFAVAEDGGVYAWGPNNYGQLGVGDDLTAQEKKDLAVSAPKLIKGFQGKKVIKMAGGDHHTIALTADGEVYTFGRGTYGQLGHGDDKDSTVPRLVEFFKNSLEAKDKVVDVASGGSHCVAVTAHGHLYTWGVGDSLQLGTGDEDGVLKPHKVVSKQLTDERRFVLAADGGASHTLIIARPRTDNE